MKTTFTSIFSRLQLNQMMFSTLLIAGVFVSSFQMAAAQKIYALSGNNIFSFDAAAPGNVTPMINITGLTPGQVVAGMDSRPATGELYIIGYNNTTGETRLYTLKANTGVATPVGASSITLAAGMDKIGFDFNPTVDRIRVTGSGTLNNYRLHPTTGALAATDGNLAFAGADVNSGMTPSIGTVAYSNSYIGATSTTLYNYDDQLNVLTTQIPPNNGTLNTVGNSGVTVHLSDQTSDLDIYYNPATNMNTAYFVANTSSGNDDLYTVNLSTGGVTMVGMINSGVAVDDIAARIIVSSPPAVTGQLIYGLTSNGYLISFDSNNPGIIRSHSSISGVTAGQVLVGLDERPATGKLYALGYNSATGASQVYKINPKKAVATAVNSTPAMLPTGLTQVSVDFNPTVDRIRVTSSNGANLRLHPDTGALLFTDGNLAYIAGDPNAAATPMIGAVAYTNSFAGSVMTQLFNYDFGLNILTLQNPPNNGTLNTIGATGISVNTTDPSVDMDIYYDPATMMNHAFLAANTGASTFDFLYTVNTTTGAVTLVDKIGFGTAVIDIAVDIESTRPAAAVAAESRESAPLENTTALPDMELYPNPSATNPNLRITVVDTKSLDIRVVNDLGLVVFSTNVVVENGTTDITLPLEKLAPATYTVLVSNDREVKTIRFVRIN
jgi:hypothetical protein